MANPRTTAPATGTLGNSPAFTHTNTTPDTQAAKARKSAALCYVLAVMVMVVTGWFIVEGVAATEPESPTRHAKVAAGILLLVLEMAVFSLAGRWRELSPVLRALGWSIFVLQVVLMSLTQIATGLTAGKTASLGTATVDEVKAQADASRQAAKALLADAEKMRSSKNAWVRQQAGQKSEAAAQQTAAGADALAQLKQLQSTSTATPVSEMIGKPGLIALSIALSLLLELAGVTLMHCAGTLRRRADGAVPVDVQILELLQRIHGAPVAPVQAAEIVALAPAQSVAPVAVAPALASFRQAGTVAPKDASSGFSYSSKTALAGAGLLAATVAPMAHSAPAVPAAGASAQSHSGASEQSHSAESQRHDTGASGAAEMPGQSETEQAHSGATEQAHPASPKAGKTDAPKRAWTATAVPDGDKLDSAVSGKGATRYNRVKTAVRAGKLKPSMRAIQLAEGGGGIVVRRYLQALEKEGVIVKSGRGFVLASKTGGEA